MGYVQVRYDSKIVIYERKCLLDWPLDQIMFWRDNNKRNKKLVLFFGTVSDSFFEESLRLRFFTSSSQPSVTRCLNKK